MKKIILLFYLYIAFSNYLFSDPCALPSDCPSKVFPYEFCDPSTNQYKTICTDDPYSQGDYLPMRSIINLSCVNIDNYTYTPEYKTVIQVIKMGMN